MLQANKATLIANVAKKSISLRQIELKFWLSVFEKFGILAAFLGGFASSVMMMDRGRRSFELNGFHLLFTIASGGAMAFNLTLLIVSVLCSLWAPGKALTGQGEDSYLQVNAVLEEMYSHSLILFECGLGCYFFASFLGAFCLFNFIGASTISFVLLLVAFQIHRYAARLRALFIPRTFVKSGLQKNPIRNIGTEMTGKKDPSLSGSIFNASFADKL